MTATTRRVIALLGTVAALATTILMAAPAEAATAGFVFWEAPGQAIITPSGSAGKEHNLIFGGVGGLTHVTMTFDFTGIAGLATPSFDDPTVKCTITGAKAICQLPDLPAASPTETNVSTTGFMQIKLVPLAGAVPGATGLVTATISAAEAPSYDSGFNVLVDDGPDLTMKPLVYKTAKPGAKSSFSFDLANTGTRPLVGFNVFFEFGHGLKPDTYSNCVYNPSYTYGTDVRCNFQDVTLAPGEASPGTFGVTVTKDAAPIETTTVSAIPLAGSVDRDLRAPNGIKAFSITGTTGKKLQLQPAVTNQDIDDSDNHELVSYAISTAFDMSVTGAHVKGKVGDSVQVTVGAANLGPASIAYPGADFPGYPGDINFIVAIPSWATVTKASVDCLGNNIATTGGGSQGPGFRFYLCAFANPIYARPGEHANRTFTFKITKSSGTDGSVTAYLGSEPAKSDLNVANDKASITLVKSSSGDQLAVTGSRTGLIAGGGAVLIALGGLLLWGGRRGRKVS